MILVSHIWISVWIILLVIIGFLYGPSKQQRNIVQLCTKISVTWMFVVWFVLLFDGLDHKEKTPGKVNGTHT